MGNKIYRKSASSDWRDGIEQDFDPLAMPAGTQVWVYLRHSPGDDQSLESQEAAILQFCNERGWNITRTFRDRGVSGSTDVRIGFEEMLYLARASRKPSGKPINAKLLIIWDHSRFARNQNRAPLYRAELRTLGLEIYSLNDHVPEGPMKKVFEAMIDWKNEQFLIDLRANTRRGLRLLVEMGCVPVGKIVQGYSNESRPLGLRKDGTHRAGRKPVIDPQQAPLIVRAFELKAQGAPHTVIAAETGLFPAKSGSWNSMFRNRAYIGEFEFNGVVYPDVYPALISKELFDAVQQRMPEIRKRILRGSYHPRRKASDYFLADVSVCAICGDSMEGKTVNRYRYYICCRRNSNVDLCSESSLVPADYVEQQIIQLLLTNILVPSYIQKLVEWTNLRLNEGISEIELQINARERELSIEQRYLEQFTINYLRFEAPTSTVERLLHEQEEKVQELKSSLAHLQQEVASRRIEISADELAYFCEHSSLLLHGTDSVYALRELIGQLFRRIRMNSTECFCEIQSPSLH